MSKPDILLKARGEGWISIHNNGSRIEGRASGDAVFSYLQSVSRHFDHVCFGTEMYGEAYTNAIKIDRLAAFKAHAAKAGLVAGFAQ